MRRFVLSVVSKLFKSSAIVGPKPAKCSEPKNERNHADTSVLSQLC